MSMSEAQLSGLLSEAEAMRAQLDDTKLALEGQSELEQQLRDTIDMLRARLHAQVCSGGKCYGKVGPCSMGVAAVCMLCSAFTLWCAVDCARGE